MTVQLDAVKQALADRYAVERVLGYGTMASVFFARDCRSGQCVAIKVLRPEFAVTLVGDRFHQEVAILKSLDHPNILPLIDSGETRSVVYYVMPFARGGSLRAQLVREKQLSLERTIPIARDVAAGLDYAHGKNIVHRDIKPGNILFEEGRATICDFGVARALIAAGGERISSSGLIVGTPYYMSPEQASGDPELGPASDIYSLACVVYEMLVGEPPFSGPSVRAVMAKHVRERPPSLRVVQPELPQRVEEAVHQALAKDPGQRPGSGEEFVKMLTRAG